MRLHLKNYWRIKFLSLRLVYIKGMECLRIFHACILFGRWTCKCLYVHFSVETWVKVIPWSLTVALWGIGNGETTHLVVATYSTQFACVKSMTRGATRCSSYTGDDGESCLLWWLCLPNRTKILANWLWVERKSRWWSVWVPLIVL